MAGKIKELRKKKLITVDMMCVRSTIPRKEYLDIEEGRKTPTDVQLRQIAVALGTDAANLI